MVGPTSTGTELEAELAVHPRSVRPVELLTALDPAPSTTVRLKRSVDKADEMALDTASTKTTRIRG